MKPTLALAVTTGLVLGGGAASAQDAIVPDDFPTISAAVAGAVDVDGNGIVEIFVRAGIYQETVIINRDDLALEGEDPATTAIDGLPAADTVQIRGDDVSVDGFTIFASGVFDSVDVQQVSGGTIQGNVLSGGASGIAANRVRGTVVADNEVTGTTLEAIKVDRGRQVLVLSNNVHDNAGEGIDVRRSNRIRVQSNLVTNNGSNGIRDVQSSRNLYVGNQSLGNNNEGFIIEQSSANRLLGNTSSQNVENGLRMKDTDNHLVSMNAFTDNGSFGVRRENWLNDDFDRSLPGVQDPPGDNDLSGNADGPLRED